MKSNLNAGSLATEPIPRWPSIAADLPATCDRCGAAVRYTVRHHATNEEICPDCCRQEYP